MLLRKSLVLALLVVFCAGVSKGWHCIRGGLRFDRCEASLYFPGSAPSAEEACVLSAPFRYLAAGRQCYAFESTDGQYVLKVPRTDIYRVLPWRDSGDRKMREAYFCRSVGLALTTLQQQTQLHAVRWESPVTLIDRLGRSHQLSATAPWLLQRKMPLLFARLQEAVRGGDRMAGQQMVEAFASLLVLLSQQGIVCKDLSFTRNIGYDGHRASFIDIGAFCPAREWPFEMTARIRPWLGELSPEMLETFDHTLWSTR